MLKRMMMCGFIFLSVSVQAGREGGNGGDVRMINGNYYSLDLIESGVHISPYFNLNAPISRQVDRDVDIVFSYPEFDDLIRMIKAKLGEIEKIDIFAAHSILLAAKNYRWVFLYDAGLIQLHDEFSNVVGKNIQIGIRQNRTIQVNGNLFLKLDKENRVAFIFHELISSLSQDSNLIIENTKARELTGAFFMESLLRNQYLSQEIICNVLPCNPGGNHVVVDQNQLYSSDIIVSGDGKSIKLDLMSLFDEDFSETTCEDMDMAHFSSIRVMLNRNRPYTLGFFDHDFTFEPYFTTAWQESSIMRFIFRTAKNIKNNIKECMKYNRRGKCRKYVEKEVTNSVPAPELFKQDCKYSLKKFQTKYKDYLSDKLVQVP